MPSGMHMRFLGWSLGRNPHMEAVGALYGPETGYVTGGLSPRKRAEIVAAESAELDCGARAASFLYSVQNNRYSYRRQPRH
jgi:hypothetical protein